MVAWKEQCEPVGLLSLGGSNEKLPVEPRGCSSCRIIAGNIGMVAANDAANSLGEIQRVSKSWKMRSPGLSFPSPH